MKSAVEMCLFAAPFAFTGVGDAQCTVAVIYFGRLKYKYRRAKAQHNDERRGQKLA